MMLCTLCSRMLGIIKARAISTCYGGGALADAINFAYNIPNSLRKLFAEGSLSASYLPLFAKNKEDKEATETLYSLILNFQLLIFIPILLITFFWGENLIRFLSNFDAVEQINVAAALLPYFTIFLIFISFASVFSAILQTRYHFLASAASPLCYSLAVIVSLYAFSGTLSHYAMALGTVVGSIAQAAVCYFAMRRFHLRYRVTFKFKNPLFVKMLKNWLPATLTSLVAIVSAQITYYFASSLPEGAITAFSNAIIFYQAPYGIFFTSLAAVYFPQLSSSCNEKERGAILSKSLVYLYTFLLPSAIILFALGKECIASLLQRGAFTLEYTLLTAKVLNYYLPAMILLAFVSMLQRYYYSRGKYNYTLIVSIVTTAIDLSFTYFFISSGGGAESISKAFAISNFVSVIILLVGAEEFPYKACFKELVKLTLINLPLFILAFVYLRMGFTYYQAGSTLANLARLVLAGIVFCLVLLAEYVIFKVPFLSALRKK